MLYVCLSYDVASGSEITPSIKIYKPQVVLQIFGKRYEITVSTLHIWQNPNVFLQNNDFKTILMLYVINRI